MREVLELSRSVVVACFLVFAAARGAEGSVAGDILSLTGGARTKVVWRRQSPPTVMIFDTNVGTEQVVTTAADGSQVFITPTGSRIVFMKNTTSLRVVDTNGANERELCAANSALGVAEDPPGTEWAYYADVAYNANPPGRLWRVQIDNTSVKEMMWDKTSICWQWAFTRDGRTAAAALPWPGCHIASLPNGSYYQVHDSGCQVAIAPSATRMLHCTALQFGGEHRGISVHVIPGGSDSEINLGDAPGVNYQTLLWPNWAMYDDRFFVISGPWTGDTGTTNILFAQFNTAFNGIANWVQVTQAPAGKQDCNPVCWIQSGSAPTNVAPTCSITSPSGGATYTAPATVSITASASDTDGTIAKVEFYQGATKLGEDTSSSGGWTYSWTSVAAGGYSLTARAFDDDGASTTSAAVSITVNPPANVAPTCSITSPSGGATYTAPAMVSITASASDTDGTVARVEFYQGATKLGEDTSSAGGWTYTWNGAPTGSYSLTVVATDDDGATTTSASVSITVNDPPNQAPSVSITSPANNATYTALASVPIAADAADSDGTVAKVEFFNGGAKLGEDADANGGWTYTWSGVAAGSYSLTAVATDDDGAATTSTAINITVNDPSNTPPTVSITSPSDGSSYAAPASISIFADASDADGSVVLVEFFAGAAKIGEDANAAGGWTLDWSGVAAGSCVLTAKATDNEGGVAISAGVTVVVLRAPDNPSGTVSGIRYDYYEGDWSNLPNFDSLTAVKSGTVATFDISVRDTADYFGFEFAGYIDIPTDGAYTFYTTSDDGSRLFIGGGMIVDNDGLHGMVEVSGTVGLAEGLHEITVTHFERTGGEGLTVSWSGPGIAKQEIPGSVLEQIPSPNNAPTVSITSPANGASYVAPADINVMATAADSDGTIARVEMHLDGTFVSSLTTTPYEWADLTGLAVGTYSIRVTAYDDDGDSAQDTITVTVTAGGGPVDTDGDGLTDALEATLGTNPTEPDTDGDGIDDGDEVNVYGTDPTEADTDADGMDDDKEIANGFDPTDDDQDDNGTPDGQDDWDNDGIDNATEVAAGDPAGDAPHMQDTPAVSCVPGGAGSAAALAMVGLIGLLLRRRTSRRSCRRRDVAGDLR